MRTRLLNRHLGRAIALAALAASTLVAASASAETVVFHNFTLIDGNGGEPVRNAAMEVTDGRIVWIGAPRSGIAGQTTVDLADKYVIPGLIDSHVHIGNTHDLTQDSKFYSIESVEADLRRYGAYGFTAVAVMGTDKDSIFSVRKAQRAGRAELPRVFSAGQGIVFRGGYGGVPNITRPVGTVAEAITEVDSQAAKGVDYIKLWLDDELGAMPKMPPEISQAVIDAAHRHGLKAFAHIFYLEDAKRLAAQGIDGFVHSVRDRSVDPALLRLMREREISQVAATLTREASLFMYGEDHPQFDDPFFKQALSPEALAQLDSPERRKTVTSGPAFPRLRSFFGNAMANIREEGRGNVRFGVGTDSGPPARFGGFAGHWELELMVQAGYTPSQALTAATKTNAEILGADDIGTLERAKWADFVVLDANPLQDIKNTRKIRAVYVAGRAIPTVSQ